MPSTSQQLPNWLDLPSDITANIIPRVGVIDIFENVQKVCTAWHKICKDPAIWRVLKMDSSSCSNERPRLRKMCKLAVDRSQGQLIDLTIEDFGNDELLRYVADRSSQLRRLELAFCYDYMYRSWNEALKKFPLLEELNLYETIISKEAIVTAGRYCPLLKTLKFVSDDEVPAEEMIMNVHEFAKAIAENLTNLRHLELIGCSMSNPGLEVILDGCCQLESLDLRDCWNIDLNKYLLKRCSEQIKHLKLPRDSLEGCPYIYKYSGVFAYAGTTISWLYPDEYEDYMEQAAAAFAANMNLNF